MIIHRDIKDVQPENIIKTKKQLSRHTIINFRKLTSGIILFYSTAPAIK